MLIIRNLICVIHFCMVFSGLHRQKNIKQKIITMITLIMNSISKFQSKARRKPINPRPRHWNTVSYDEILINKVWEKGKIVPRYDKSIIRKDICGNWIERADFENDSDNAWVMVSRPSFLRQEETDISHIPLNKNNAIKIGNQYVWGYELSSN